MNSSLPNPDGSEGKGENRTSVLISPDTLRPLDLCVSPIWVFDIDRHAMWWANTAAVQFWQSPSREALLQRDYSSDSDTVRKRLRQIFENATTDIPASEIWTLYPANSPVSVKVSMTPVRVGPELHNALLIEITSHDQTQIDATDWRLVESTRYTPIMISYFTVNGRLISMNPAAIEAYGPESRSPIPGSDLQHSLSSRFICHSALENILFEAANGGEPSGEYQVSTQDGQRWHRIDIRQGRDPVTGDACIVVVEEDISSLKQAVFDLEELNSTLEERVEERTKALKEARYRAEEANKAKSDFLARMSHDLRTPLNAIIGFSDILSSEDTQSLAETRYREYGNDIHHAAKNLLALVNDLLDLSRIEAGKFPIHIEKFDIANLFKDSAVLFQAVTDQRKISLDLSRCRQAPVASDRRALQLVVTNLMTNAMKYNRIGGSVCVTVNSLPELASTQVQIEDTGVGIPEPDLRDIFEPYVRGRADLSSGMEGTGLGLPICKRLCDLLSIGIDIQSAVDFGTTVSLTIPNKITNSAKNA